MRKKISSRPRSSDFNRVLGGLSWTLLGEITFAAAQFGLLIAMARLGSEATLGRYALGLAIATPLFVLTGLHLRPTYVVQDDTGHTFGDYLGLRLLGAPLACVLAAVWSMLAGHDVRTTLVVLLVAVTRLSELIADICHAAALREEQMKRVGVSRALRGVLLVGTASLLLALDRSEVVALAAAALAAAVLTVAYDLPTAKRFATLRPRFAWRPMRRLIVLAAPAGLAAGLLGLTMNSPLYVLEQAPTGGVQVVGRYAAVVSVMFIGGVLNAAMGSAAVPRLARLYPVDRAAFRALLLRVVAVVGVAGLCICSGCLFLGDVYLGVAYGAAFVDLAPLLRIVGAVVLAAGVANLLSQTLVAMRYFRLQFAINAVTFVVGLTLSLGIIPQRGIVGALWVIAIVTALRLATYSGTIALLSRQRA